MGKLPALSHWELGQTFIELFVVELGARTPFLGCKPPFGGGLETVRDRQLGPSCDHRIQVAPGDPSNLPTTTLGLLCFVALTTGTSEASDRWEGLEGPCSPPSPLLPTQRYPKEKGMGIRRSPHSVLLWGCESGGFGAVGGLDRAWGWGQWGYIKNYLSQIPVAQSNLLFSAGNG